MDCLFLCCADATNVISTVEMYLQYDCYVGLKPVLCLKFKVVTTRTIHCVNESYLEKFYVKWTSAVFNLL